MNDFLAILRSLDWSVPVQILLSVIPALICITLHECAHGFVAWRLGDDTAKRMGRLSLNPIKHLDIMGLIMLAVFHFGWAKPVPVNMYNFRNPKRGMAITAAAGPVMNLIICIIALFVYGLLFYPLYGSTAGYYVLETVYMTAYLSLTLALFNIIPIPPLDGSKMLYSFISDRAWTRLMYFERYGMPVLLVLVVVMNRLPYDPLTIASNWIFSRLFMVAGWGYDLVRLFV